MTPMRGASSSVEPIRVQTRFERFPASIKGAFVMAGADGNPHAVKIERAEVIRVPGGPSKPVPVEERAMDVAPARDLFVPFEVGVTDLEPGWYRLVSAVRVDAAQVWDFQSRPFTIPWPRNDVRRGSYPVDRTITVDRVAFLVERVELGSDASVVVWRKKSQKAEKAGGGGEGEAIVMADGAELPLVPVVPGTRAFEPGLPGERRTVSYPVPRQARRLEVVLRLVSGSRSQSVPVQLL